MQTEKTKTTVAVTAVVLTGMLACSNIYEQNGKKYLTNDINPFYGTTKEVVLSDFEYAKEVYKKVFTRLTCYHYENQERLIPPKEWSVLVV